MATQTLALGFLFGKKYLPHKGAHILCKLECQIKPIYTKMKKKLKEMSIPFNVRQTFFLIKIKRKEKTKQNLSLLKCRDLINEKKIANLETDKNMI